MYFNEAGDDGGDSGISWFMSKSFASRYRQKTTQELHHFYRVPALTGWLG